MKTLTALAFATLCAATAHAATPIKKVVPVKIVPKSIVMRCAPTGDSLGSLEISVLGSAITMTENAMDGSVIRSKLEATGPDTSGALAAIRAGTPFALWYRSPGATEFGGAVMKAGLLSIEARQASGQRAGYLSRRDIVYKLICTLP